MDDREHVDDSSPKDSSDSAVSLQLAEYQRQETSLRESVEFSKQAVSALVAYAVENGADPSSFSHLEEVWQPDGFSIVPASAMPKGMVAGTSPVTGKVWVVDKYADRREAVLHESFHRTTHIGWNKNKTRSLKAQLAEMYGLQVGTDGKISPETPFFAEVPAEEREAMVHFWNEAVNDDRAKLEEGVTEWAVQKTHGLKRPDGTKIVIRPELRVYPEQVQAIEDLKGQIQRHSNITPQQADSSLITSSLTGDISKIGQMAGGNYMVSAILRNTPSAYAGRIA